MTVDTLKGLFSQMGAFFRFREISTSKTIESGDLNDGMKCTRHSAQMGLSYLASLKIRVEQEAQRKECFHIFYFTDFETTHKACYSNMMVLLYTTPTKKGNIWILSSLDRCMERGGPISKSSSCLS